MSTLTPTPKPRKRDKYDREIERLSKMDEWEMQRQWSGSPSISILFRHCTPDGIGGTTRTCKDDSLRAYGCLTTIRASSISIAWTPKLTAAIRADTRIPSRQWLIKHSDLPVFAEWQRRLDREIRGEKGGAK